MPTVRCILVPVDFSAGSAAALDYAMFLADQFHAQLDVLHVWEQTEDLASGWALRENAEMVAKPKEEFLYSVPGQDLLRLVQELDHQRPGMVRGRLEAGDAAARIAEIAVADSYDMIVVGTHGRRGFSHLFLGSVAEGVIRRASCPVVTVRNPQGAPQLEKKTSGQ